MNKLQRRRKKSRVNSLLFLVLLSLISMRTTTNNISINNHQSYDDHDEISSWFEQNLTKLIVIICLILIIIGCAITLTIILIKQNQREKQLLAKKNSWSAKLEQIAPIVKIAGPIIKMIIKITMSLILL